MNRKYRNMIMQEVEEQAMAEQKRLNTFRDECQQKDQRELLAMVTERALLIVGISGSISSAGVLLNGFLGLAQAKVIAELEVISELIGEIENIR